MAENYNGCIFTYNKMKRITSNNETTSKCLLAHSLFYLSNELVKNNDSDSIFYSQASKMLLLLHSLPFKFNDVDSFFNNKDSKHGGFEYVPYGYLCLLGGLLYRKKLLNSKHIDILKCVDEKHEANKELKFPTEDETYYVNGEFTLISKDSTTSYDKYNTLFKNEFNKIIANKLIKLFIDLVKEEGAFFSSYGLKFETYNNGLPQNKIVDCSYDMMLSLYKFLGSDNFNLQDTINYVKDINTWFHNKSDKQFIIDGIEYKPVNFDLFSLAFVKNQTLYLIYKESDTKLQAFFDKLYNHQTGAITNYSVNNTETKKIKTDLFQNVVVGFTKTIKKLCDDSTDIEGCQIENDLSGTRNVADNDLKKLIYNTTKQFWDKWLCGVYNNYGDDFKSQSTDKLVPFTVKWLDNMFLFIDSFYIRQDSILKLNCSKLLSRFEEVLTTGGQTYMFLAGIANDHNCDIYCYPDFIDFRNGNMEDVVQDMFKPLPYSQLTRNMECENRFVIMKVYPLQYGLTTNDFSSDGWDIKDDILPEPEPSKFYTDEFINKQLKVISFGVCFGRQYNHIFKSIDISTESLQTTEQSIRIMDEISELGNSNKRNVSYYGSDIFGVYSSYSYIVTVTMMGNVQVQPLMYFQLMNVPMFHGVYIIIEVKHSIRQGEFTTVIRGMKLSRVMIPSSEAWFAIGKQGSDISLDNSNGDNCNEEIVQNDNN